LRVTHSPGLGNRLSGGHALIDLPACVGRGSGESPPRADDDVIGRSNYLKVLVGDPGGVYSEVSVARPPKGDRWWRDAVVYQVYVRSFADANGDGIGDLAGVRSRLSYLRELGVDALWFSPWYASPMADGGYDIADYRSIDPALGTLAEAEELIADAHAFGIRTIVDIVPNHVSNRHPWFRGALASPPGSPMRARFWFRPGAGRDGELPPNGWQSIFGGSAWTRTADEAGEWYLHLFAPEQPDLNWTDPAVWAEHEDVLRFWFDRGVAGVRIDSAGLLVKDPELSEESAERAAGEHPFTDRDGVHEIYRRWRSIADSYGDPRVLVGEIALPDAERLARYLRPDELHTALNCEPLARPWDAEHVYDSIESTLAAHATVDAPATWVLSSHDVARQASGNGHADSSFARASKRSDTPANLELGTRRARAAALLAMALPGSLCISQGEELGLPEVEDSAPERRQGPMWQRSGGVDPGRDGSRIAIPWAGDHPPYGFAADGAARPWLDPPVDWGSLTVSAQALHESSMLSLYRAGLRLRRDAPWGDEDGLQWLAAPRSVIAFTRGEGFSCFVNLGREPADLPAGAQVLIASSELEGGALPPDTAVWLTQPAA
jgi:alpha-glucosidase